MPKPKYAAYEAADPYFTLVRGALGDLVDGQHFFDIVAENVIYEVLYDLGWPRAIEGRANLMAAFRSYVGKIALQSADQLITHKTDDGSVIEYEVRGGFGFSDRGVSGVLPGQYSNRRADIHEKAKT